MVDDDLRVELLAMAGEDRDVRAALAEDGSLYEGYHPQMEDVHRRNAARLKDIIEANGWPGSSLVGADGADAAWCIAQHAIGEPDFQRRSLEFLRGAAASGEVPAWQPAMLEDRIRIFEGRPQRYGTQLAPDEDGRLRPYAIEDPENVEERRRAVGLEPIAVVLERLHGSVPEPVPRDRVRWEHEYAAWLRRVGWRR